MSENKNEQPQAVQTEQELNELLQIRRDKLAKLQEAGKDPFTITTCPRDHYAQEIRLDDIAAHVNICKNECCRFFKKHMKMTIFDYILFLRIQNSLALLREGESITRTASLVGFSSPAYYGQIFRRYMKCTPREYQKGDRSLPLK